MLIGFFAGLKNWREVMETEILKPVKGYEENYKISSAGVVYTVSHLAKSVHGGVHMVPAKKKKETVSKIGYPVVNLWKDGKGKLQFVHRLVAEAFLDNTRNLKYVNHKDGNKTNNNVSNLEWCTCSENVQHAYDTGLISKGDRVRCIETGIVYKNCRDATISLGLKCAEHIHKCAIGERNTAYGMHWEIVK